MDLLQVKNGKIVDEVENEVYLRGTCVGGWMNLEDFINAYPGTESGLRRNMSEVIGASKTDLFFSSLLENFFNESDIAFIKQTGANCIRIPLNYRHFESDDNPFEYKEEGFKRLDHIIKICDNYGIYVILDMHAVPGWQNCHWHSDNERGASLLWEHKQFQDRLTALWEEFAHRYANCKTVAGYDLMNEPSTGNPSGEHAFDFYENYKANWKIINTFYRRLTEAIRKIDKKHIIFLEGDYYSRLFSGLDAPFDDNLVYSSHNYIAPGFGPGTYPGLYGSDSGDYYWDKNAQHVAFLNHEGAVFTRKHNVPLWVGEFGSQYHGPANELPYRLKSMDDQLSIYNGYGVHWTTWTYKDAGVMGWATLNPESEYMQMVSPIQKMKKRLGAENFVALYNEECKGKELSRALSDYILTVSGNAMLSQDANAYTLNYAALTGFAAATLQPSYAKRFKGCSEDDIERITQAFHIKNCIINEPYVELLKNRISD